MTTTTKNTGVSVTAGLLAAAVLLAATPASANEYWTMWSGRCNRSDATGGAGGSDFVACDLPTFAPYRLVDLTNMTIRVSQQHHPTLTRDIDYRICAWSIDGSFGKTCGSSDTHTVPTGSDTSWFSIEVSSTGDIDLPTSFDDGPEHLFLEFYDPDNGLNNDPDEMRANPIHVYVEVASPTPDNTSETRDMYSGAFCKANLDYGGYLISDLDGTSPSTTTGSWPVDENTECSLLTPGRMMVGGLGNDMRLPEDLETLQVLIEAEDEDSTLDKGKVCAKKIEGGVSVSCLTAEPITSGISSKTQHYVPLVYTGTAPDPSNNWSSNPPNNSELWHMYVALQCKDDSHCRVYGYSANWTSL